MRPGCGRWRLQGIIVRASYSVDLGLEGYTAPTNCAERLRGKRGAGVVLRLSLSSLLPTVASIECNERRANYVELVKDRAKLGCRHQSRTRASNSGRQATPHRETYGEAEDA